MYERGEQEEAAMKRKLRIDLNELDMALNFGISAFSHYLDLHTGRVLRVDDMDWTPQSLLQQRGDACEWKRDVLLDAARVAFDGQGRYLAIEPGDPYRDHDDMLTFVATLEDEDLQEQLQCAIYDRGASCCFRRVVARYPDLQEQWYAHKDARAERRVLRWLEKHGIERIA
jgi:hypothetical protein